MKNLHAQIAFSATPGLARARSFVGNLRELTLQYGDDSARAGGRPNGVLVDLPASMLDCLTIDLESAERELNIALDHLIAEIDHRKQAEKLLRFERNAFTVSLLALAVVFFAAFSHAYGGGL